jgi:hypothetical protein
MSQDVSKLLPDIMREAIGLLHQYGRGDHRKAEQSLEHAKSVLKNNASTATAVFIAMQRLLGNNAFLAWEPESIWLECADRGVENLPQENRDKILAVATLLYGDAFHWDALVFEKTVLAFNDIPTAPDMIQEASPGELAWGAFEAELLAQYAGHNNEYDYEPTRYTGLSMHRAGLVLAPELLVFAQEELDKFNSAQDELKETVGERWGLTDKEKLEDLDLKENPEDVQIGYLASVHLYLGKRAQQLRKELSAF